MAITRGQAPKPQAFDDNAFGCVLARAGHGRDLRLAHSGHANVGAVGVFIVDPFLEPERTVAATNVWLFFAVRGSFEE